jgi:glutamine---fructose-6-phosphate transaminase (isomerizing)
MNHIGEIMASEISETPSIFARIIENSSIFDGVKNLLDDKKIRSILILARGTSDNAAHFLKYLVETQLGLPCGLTSPSSITIYHSTLHYEGTLIIAISQSGQSPDLVGFATSAKNAGATLISMTNDDQSPLATMADFHFSLSAGPELAVAATKSYSAQLLISYLLVSTWSGKIFDGQLLISQAEKLASNRDLVLHAVGALSRDREIVVLGRGFAYPNAREAALKIQETVKVSVQGLSTADYLHGPISALTPNTQVLLIAPFHIPSGSMEEAVSKIRLQVPTLMWIGNGGSPRGNDIVIPGSQCEDEIVSTIADAISLQRLAMEFAVRSGFDPDAPEGLSKVTLTN